MFCGFVSVFKHPTKIRFLQLHKEIARDLPEQSACLLEKIGFSLLIDSVALMNHSCCPNVIVTYKGTLAEVRAVQEINPGEEVSAWPLAAVA